MKISIIACFLITALLFSGAQQASLAGSATWSTNAISSDWNSAENWVPNTVPNDPADVATFTQSNVKQVFISEVTELSDLNFNSGADSFTLTGEPGTACIISGAGITNNSGKIQTFTNQVDGGFQSGFTFENGASAGEETVFLAKGGAVTFSDSADAGEAMITLAQGPDLQPAYLTFFDNGSAGDATIQTEFAGFTFFDGNSTAANAIINCVGGDVDFSINSTAATCVLTCSAGGGFGFGNSATAANGQFTAGGAETSDGSGCFVNLSGDTTAEDATFVINGGSASDAPGAVMTFFGQATAANATLTANGGTAGGLGGSIIFTSKADGGTASFALNGNGNLDLSQHRSSPLAIGSLEGNGLVFLGVSSLTVGNNNRGTTFPGIIQDGGLGGGVGGSLTKIGTGTLTLSGANTYTGMTTVAGGALLTANTTGSATGSGALSVATGTFGGSGIVSGAVTVGTGGGAGAFLAPAFGGNNQVILTLQSSLTLQADATYTYTFRANQNRARTDQVVANGVIIDNATVAIVATTHGRMRRGTVLIVISNTSADPISGTFNNLADGAIVQVNGNKLQASYTGGDGNDLTLTVVR